MRIDLCVGERGVVSHPPLRKLARQLDHLAHPLPRALRPGPLRHELLHLKVRKWALERVYSEWKGGGPRRALPRWALSPGHSVSVSRERGQRS